MLGALAVGGVLLLGAGCGGDGKADTIAGLAPKFLPRRVTRVLTSRVEMAPAGKLLGGLGKKGQPLIYEIPQTEPELETGVDSRSRTRG